MNDLKSLRDLAADNVVAGFPGLFTDIAVERSREILTKRRGVLKTAWEVIDKIEGEIKKEDKPDVAGTFSADGVVAMAPGYTEGKLKKLKELRQRLDSMVKAFTECGTAAQSLDKVQINDAFAKLNQATDKASKGVKGGDASDESDAA